MSRSYDFPSPKAARFPNVVVVAVNNRCTYRCVHCYYPAYVKTPQYQPHDLDGSVFRRIVEEMGEYPWSALRLIGWGEPLRHPRLVEFVAMARRAAPHNPITLITNGHDLSPPRSLALMEAGLDLVEVSIDAATPEHYNRLRQTPDPDAFAHVEANVEAMLRHRGEQGLHTRVAVSFILWPGAESAAELGRFRRRWAGLADEVVERPLHSFMGAVPQAPARIGCGPRPPCYALWARLAVNPWGEASVCYNDWARQDLLGDLHDPQVTIAGLWRGAALERRRRGQCAGKFAGVCQGCRDYNPQAWALPYEQVIARCRRSDGIACRTLVLDEQVSRTRDCQWRQSMNGAELADTDQPILFRSRPSAC